MSDSRQLWFDPGSSRYGRLVTVIEWQRLLRELLLSSERQICLMERYKTRNASERPVVHTEERIRWGRNIGKIKVWRIRSWTHPYTSLSDWVIPVSPPALGVGRMFTAMITWNSRLARRGVTLIVLVQQQGLCRPPNMNLCPMSGRAYHPPHISIYSKNAFQISVARNDESPYIAMRIARNILRTLLH